jgi:hypothetical protein
MTTTVVINGLLTRQPFPPKNFNKIDQNLTKSGRQLTDLVRQPRKSPSNATNTLNSPLNIVTALGINGPCLKRLTVW